MGIPKMLEQGQIKGFLLDNWQRSTGQASLNRTIKLRSKESLIMAASYFLGALLLGAMIKDNKNAEAIPVLYVAIKTVLSFCFAFCLASCFVGLREAFCLDGRNLAKDLKNLKIILYGSEKLSFVCHTQETLSKRAKEVLINKIAQFLVCETGLDDDESLVWVQRQKKEVQEVHHLLRIFDLVDFTYDEYFAKARRFLAETNWQK